MATGTQKTTNDNNGRGRHESEGWYYECQRRSRNKGLFLADQWAARLGVPLYFHGQWTPEFGAQFLDLVVTQLQAYRSSQYVPEAYMTANANGPGPGHYAESRCREEALQGYRTTSIGGCQSTYDGGCWDQVYSSAGIDLTDFPEHPCQASTAQYECKKVLNKLICQKVFPPKEFVMDLDLVGNPCIKYPHLCVDKELNDLQLTNRKPIRRYERSRRQYEHAVTRAAKRLRAVAAAPK